MVIKKAIGVTGLKMDIAIFEDKQFDFIIQMNRICITHGGRTLFGNREKIKL